MERPGETGEADGQAGEGYVDIGARIAEAAGGLAQVAGHFRQQFRLMEVEGLAQLEQQRPFGGGICGHTEAEAGGGMSVEIRSGVDRKHDEARLLRSGLQIGRKTGFEASTHNCHLIVSAGDNCRKPCRKGSIQRWARSGHQRGRPGVRGASAIFAIAGNHRRFALVKAATFQNPDRLVANTSEFPGRKAGSLCILFAAPPWQYSHLSN